MARVTVEDCLDVLGPNRFELTLLAAKRARQIAKGSAPLIEDVGKDKPTVTALREISEGKINQEIFEQIELATMMAERIDTEVEEETPRG